MSSLDHWHPVLDAKQLGTKPMHVRLDQRDIVLFRDGQGNIGALDDCCPHRRMRLSLGLVVEGKLRCQYHGWTYDCHGAGESPGTPKLHATATCFETEERWGWIWIKAEGSASEFPVFDVAGYRTVGAMRHEIDAPLEILLDNFTEVEHTPTTHALLGYELSQMSQVETLVEPTDTSVRVFNAGPQKYIPRAIAFLFGINTGDRFVDDWTTRFSPVHACYDQYWSDAATLKEKGVRWRIYVFFNPIDPGRTALTTFAFLKPAADGGWRNWLLFNRGLLSLIEREILLDKRMVEGLADKRPDVEGMKLSRFDKVLGLHRARIARIYRGEQEPSESLSRKAIQT